MRAPCLDCGFWPAHGVIDRLIEQVIARHAYFMALRSVPLVPDAFLTAAVRPSPAVQLDRALRAALKR